jgi:hypothetical protein
MGKTHLSTAIGIEAVNWLLVSVLASVRRHDKKRKGLNRIFCGEEVAMVFVLRDYYLLVQHIN